METQAHPESKTRLSTSLFILVILFATLPHMIVDMYIPSLPAIVHGLQTNAATVQLTLTAFMIGYSVMHLIYGPISDGVGRRKPLLGGILLSTIGTLICLAAPSIQVLIIGRFLQGIGIASCNSVGRSVVRDVASGPHLARISSHLGMVMVFVLTTAPTVGGYLQYYFNWRAVFLFLFLYTSVSLVTCWKFLPETNLNLNPHAVKIKTMLQNYITLLTSRVFIGYTLCVSCAYAGIIAYVTCAPFLIQNVIGLNSKQFGFLSFVTGAAIFSSFVINGKLVLKKGIEKMVLLGISLILLSGIIMLSLALLGFLNVFVIIFPVAIFCMGAGFTFSNGAAGALQPFATIAGVSGGLFGFLQVLGGVIASAVMAGLNVHTQIPLAIVGILLGIVALSSFKFLATR